MTGDKFQQLLSYLKDLGHVAVAFSGGVDSTLLLKAASMALQDDVLAVSVKTPYIPEWELEEAIAFTKENNIRHRILQFEFKDQLRGNPKDRCYLCKTNLFRYMQDEIRMEGIPYLLDGTNFDDLGDYRPGLKALKELGIRSPLLELKITKAEIRQFSRELHLSTSDKPAYACLLTRIPYDEPVSDDLLVRIGKAETCLRTLGFMGSRVRTHGNLARIEIPWQSLPGVLNADLFRKITAELKSLGFGYVTLDMEGYRMGSHNESL